MSIADLNLQRDVLNEVDRMKNATCVPKSKDQVGTEVLENFHARADARGKTFEADEPEYKAGGRDAGPRPLEYFLAGFAFCQGAIYVENALQNGLAHDGLSIEVDGDIDPRGTLGIDDFPPGFADNQLTYRTSIESPETEDDIRRLVAEAEEFCPANAALRNPMPFDRTIQLNGEPLDGI